MAGSSTYIIKLSGLNLISEVHLPNLVTEIRNRRNDLGWAGVHTHGAFDGDAFNAAYEEFRAAIDDLQELQSETIRRLEMGSDGLKKIVEHHEATETWITDELSAYEAELSTDVTEY